MNMADQGVFPMDSAYKLFGEILGFSYIDTPDIDACDFNETQAKRTSPDL